MRLVFRELNNKGLPSRRPWRVENLFGGYVTSFETHEAAQAFLERTP